MEKKARILVAGAETLIGSAIGRLLEEQGHEHVLKATVEWTRANDVEAYFAQEQPEYVFLAAGKSGGIRANQKFPADLMLDNLCTTSHIIRSAHFHGTKKLLYLASSCSYPRHCPQPMKEEYLMTGLLEPTNEAYATAKLAGINLCAAYRDQYNCRFIAGIPANVYGPWDDFDPEDSHVIAALIRRMDAAKRGGEDSVTVWGTGTPQREFIFVDDLAAASICVMRAYDARSPINLGAGEAVSVAALAQTVREVVRYPGRLVFDATKPDGMPIKALDSSKLLGFGWRPRYSLRAGIERTYAWYCQAAKHER